MVLTCLENSRGNTREGSIPSLAARTETGGEPLALRSHPFPVDQIRGRALAWSALASHSRVVENLALTQENTGFESLAGHARLSGSCG